MAIINNREVTVWDFLFVAAGLLSVIWFFADYDNQHPYKIADHSLDEESSVVYAVDIMSRLGYSVAGYDNEVTFESNSRLLDSLQHRVGRRSIIAGLTEQKTNNLIPFYWRILFEKQVESDGENVIDNQSGSSEFSFISGFEVQQMELYLDEQGRWFTLLNEDNMLPQREVDKNALHSYLASRFDNLEVDITGITDSMLVNSLIFRANMGESSIQITSSDQFLRNVRNGNTVPLGRRAAFALAEYHLSNSAWNLSELERDTVIVESFKSRNAAKVRFIMNDIKYGQSGVIEAHILPTGAILNVSMNYNQSQNSGTNQFPLLWELVHLVFLLVFVVGVIVIFFFRIRARAIDTKSALVISIVFAFMIPVTILLENFDELAFFGGNDNWFQTIQTLITMGIGGAGAVVLFFVLSALGDSITRQYWPDKLSSYDYLRQGFLFNKPIGVVLVRSVVLAFLLAGFLNTLLLFFPNLFIKINNVFIDEQATWPVLYYLFEQAWVSFTFVLSLFLVLGSQIYAQTGSKIWTIAVIMLGAAIAGPVTLDVGPWTMQIIVYGILGAVLGLIYVKWDFLTVFLSQFLFSVLLGLSSGWMIPDSPDLILFVSCIVLFVFTGVGGTLSIFLGKAERTLPDFIPEYVEELAQEQRIKQELQIARRVQQSFLPAKMPEIADLDLSAICKPAYETGGDYYDVIPLENRRIAVAIGDVSGKGIQAAFYMTFIKGILHSLCRETDSPADLMVKANRLFYLNAVRGTFVSLIYGIIDLEKQVFRFARAGHNPIIFYKTANDSWEELKPTGLGLGMTDSQKFENNIKEITLPLAKDDLLLLYTDGIVESQNKASQLYGNQRLIQNLKNNRLKSCKEIISEITNDVSRFVGEASQHDDMTMLAIKYCKD